MLLQLISSVNQKVSAALTFLLVQRGNNFKNAFVEIAGLQVIFLTKQKRR